MRPNEVIILCGGLGTRLRPVVSDLPKVLAPVSNRPFLFYVLDFWIKKGIKNFVLCTGYKGELVRTTVNSSPYKTMVKFSHETETLGTGGAVLRGMKLVKSNDFLVQNGDTFIPIDLHEVHRLREKIKNKAIMMTLIKQEDMSRYGLFSLNEDFLVSNINHFNEGKKFINGGIYVCNKKKLLKSFTDKNKEISFENEILPFFLDRREVIGNLCNKAFIDIGIPNDYKRAYKFFKRQTNS